MRRFNEELPFVNVELIPCKERSIGIDFETIDGTKVVKELDEDGLAFLSMKVGIGFKLVDVGGGDPSESEGVLEGVLCQKVLLRFRRPLAPPPIHGFARKNLHKTPKFYYHEDQVEWLNEYWKQNKAVGIRAGDMHIAMKAKFQHQLRDNGTGLPKTVMWLDEQRIRSWIVGVKKEAKEAKKEIERELKKAKKLKQEEEKPKIWEESDAESEEENDVVGEEVSAVTMKRGRGKNKKKNSANETGAKPKNSQNKKKRKQVTENVSDYDDDGDSSGDDSL
jgi:hypothetical protein